MMSFSFRRVVLLWTSFVLCTVFLSCQSQAAQVENKDVVEGQSLRLMCRFNPALANRDLIYYWIHTPPNRYVRDNVAIGGTAFDHYEVDFVPREGKYDLLIASSLYDKDNGEFECKLKEGAANIETDTFTVNYFVTVLIPPGQPQISPSTPIAREGEPFALTCSSEGGNPDPLIQWYREGTPLQAQLQKGGSRDRPTSSILTITPGMEDDRATYRCVVWNRAIREEMKLEATVTLRVHYAPRVTVGPYNPLNVMVNSDAVLTCAVQANPPVRTVRWLKDGQLLSNTYNHTIPRVTPEDSGTYACLADNGVNEGTREELELSVLYGPQVNLVGEREVQKGESVSIKCNVASNPPPHSLYWLKEDDNFFRQSGDTLVLDDIAAEDTGKYMCVATNILRPSGSTFQKEETSNGTISIRVKHKPGDTEILPVNPVAIANRPFTMSCIARPPGWPAPDYRWWKEGHENQELGRRANYSFVSVHVSHEGRYYCQPQNALGQGSLASVYLTVHEPATIIIPMPPQMVKKDSVSGVSITCRARGKPKPRVRWMQNGQEIPPDSSLFRADTKEILEDHNVYSVQSSLFFEGSGRKGNTLSPTDRGRYTCEFDNGVGEPARSEMTLRVEHAPVVRHTYNRVAFDAGETAVLQCKMQAYPEPRFEWFFQGRLLETYGNYGTNVTDLGEDIYAGVLSIKTVKEEDYGDYTCRAWNQIGDDEKTIIKLVKKSAPETPVDLAIVDINSDTVTLRWHEGFNGGFANTEFIVTYTNMETGRSRNESCRSHNPCTITGLNSNTYYTFKVMAINPRGYSQYSEELQGTTKVNLRDMPRAADAQYDKDRHILSFRVDQTRLPLVAKIEVRANGDERWYQHRTLPVESEYEKVVLSPPMGGFSDVRVILCLKSNDSWCGDERLAVPTDEVAPHAWETRSPLSTENLVIIIVVTASVCVVMAILLFCCCWRKRNQKGKKDYEMETANVRPKVVAPPYYPDGGVINKGLDNNMEDPTKAPIYTTSLPNGQSALNGGMNGHLPQNTHPSTILYNSDRDPSPCGGNDSHSDLWIKSGGDMPPEGSYQHYDGGIPNGYFYPEDYQPLTEDMMNMKNRDHLHSPYYDVSGLPDPYAMGEDEKAQHISLSFDESLESGYSTPNSRNRRVIREIIV